MPTHTLSPASRSSPPTPRNVQTIRAAAFADAAGAIAASTAIDTAAATAATRASVAPFPRGRRPDRRFWRLRLKRGSQHRFKARGPGPDTRSNVGRPHAIADMRAVVAAGLPLPVNSSCLRILSTRSYYIVVTAPSRGGAQAPCRRPRNNPRGCAKK